LAGEFLKDRIPLAPGPLALWRTLPKKGIAVALRIPNRLIATIGSTRLKPACLLIEAYPVDGRVS